MLLILALLILLLTSCADKPVIQSCPSIPSALLAHLDRTAFNGQTYGDVAKYSVILKRERDVCMDRVDKIRELQKEDLNK
ncbi:Rz1-like lysis system protein LysC [Pasteurella multocida]|uniref:Rz1-like lysis system protein LysC n=1 Tax=Pasteurella multocida TaxID=747 RepID=UPI003C12FDA8